MTLVNIYGFSYLQMKKSVDNFVSFLNTHGTTTCLRRVSTDQGRELAKSTTFREFIAKAGYTLENTGAEASFQNEIVERPHCTLTDMMHTMLPGANLTSDYWTHSIRHAIYIKNHIPHHALSGHITPLPSNQSPPRFVTHTCIRLLCHSKATTHPPHKTGYNPYRH